MADGPGDQNPRREQHAPGSDALLGLLPIGGDLLTGLVQAGLVLVALKYYRVPKSVAARMVGNVLLDVAVGAIPVLGDMFDAVFKANTEHEASGTVPGAIAIPSWKLHPRHRSGGWPVTQIDGPLRAGLVHGRAGRRGKLPTAIWRAVLVAALTLMIIGLVTLVRWLL